MLNPGHVTYTRTLGVSSHRDKGKKRACISFQGRQRRLGSFATQEEAARAYDAEATKLRATPVLNFMPDGSMNPNRKLSGFVPPRRDAEESEGDSSSDSEGEGKGGRQAASQQLPRYDNDAWISRQQVACYCLLTACHCSTQAILHIRAR